MQSSRRTFAIAVTAVICVSLAGPATTIARGTTPQRAAAPPRSTVAAHALPAGEQTLPDRKPDTLVRRATLTRLPQRGGAKPTLAPANRVELAKLASGSTAADSKPAVTDTGPHTFNVGSSGDEGDADVGDGICAVSGGGCTLRAAIQEANSTPDKDTITFSVSSVAPASALPAITQPVTIDGGTASATQITGSDDPTDLNPGLVIAGGGSTLENITVNDFHSVGVLLTIAGNDTVTGCHIGTNAAGNAAAPNGTFTSASAGLEIETTGSQIGGPDAADRNTISGNDGFGIFIASGADNTHVQANTIGLDSSGTSSVPNRVGVLVSYYTGTPASTEAKNVIIGGPDPADGNLVAGNSKPAGSASTQTFIGLDVLDNGTTITNNSIGLNADGDAAGNGVGVWLSNVASAVLGAPGQGNVIAGNLSDGVRLDGAGATGDLIQANDIGTDPDSDPGLGNGGAGVDYFYEPGEAASDAPSAVTIGGTAGKGNVISANGITGIRVLGPGGNTIAGNFIGTNDAGTEPLHNKQDAIQLAATPNNTVGGTDPGSGNVIGADNAGVLLVGSATKGNIVEGNDIGVDSDGHKLGIGGSGVDLQSQASGNIIGYGVAGTPATTCTAACNTISDAAGDGVRLDGSVNQDTIRGNSIYGNKELPIALVDKAVDASEPLANDEHDTDKGGNGALNFPTGVVATVQPAGNPDLLGSGTTIVTGTLSPAPASPTDEIVDIFGLTATDDISDPQPSNQVDSWGEARAWLGTATVQPDGTFWLPLTSDEVATYESYSATATDAGGNTSEVSPICMPIDGNTSDDADGDGICDEWETRGIDFDGNGTRDVDLKAYGASPNQRDLFAEIDYFAGETPERQALLDMQLAFAKAPVSASNNSSSTGIQLHFGATEHGPLTDEEITPTDSDRTMTPDKLRAIRDGAADKDCDGHFGSVADRASPNCWEVLGAKHLVWRYILFADQLDGDAGITGKGDIGGRTAVVMLGGPESSSNLPNTTIPKDLAVGGGYPTRCTDEATCLAQTQESVLMHEFGHNLGLHHGGGDDTNDKPNYLSIMNYNLNYRNVDPNRPLDYSHVALPDLNESALVESASIEGGISPARLGDWRTAPYLTQQRVNGTIVPNTCIRRLVPVSAAFVDWNNNGSRDTGTVAEPEFTDGTHGYTCTRPTVNSQLISFDDWDNLQYTPVPVYYNTWAWPGPAIVGDAARARAAASSQTDEPDPDLWQVAMTSDADGDGVVNARDNCPGVANSSQQRSSVKGIGKACVALIKQRDLSVTMRISGKARRGKMLHLTVSLKDGYPLAATKDIVSVKVPRGLKLRSARASSGAYKKSTGRWTIRSIGGEKTVTLVLVVKVTGKLPTTATAELIKAGQPDPNSKPNNHNIYEDDEARHVIG